MSAMVAWVAAEKEQEGQSRNDLHRAAVVPEIAGGQAGGGGGQGHVDRAVWLDG